MVSLCFISSSLVTRLASTRLEGHLIKHHERFTPFIMADDSATSSSMADVKVSALLNGTQGDAGKTLLHSYTHLSPSSSTL
jgi:hypothetical protein